MTELDVFTNILKDCWTGRVYQTNNKVWTTNVITDNGETVLCEIFNIEPSSEENGIHIVDEVTKEELKHYFKDYGFGRVK